MSDWKLWAWCIVGAILMGIVTRIAGWIEEHRHHHRFKDQYGGLYADEPDGPKTYHEIWWECSCGKTIAEDAKRRAEFCVKHNITYVKPGAWPSAEMYFAG